MDVKDILEAKNINYRQRGGDYIIRCLNPQHEDKNPSLRVDMISGIMHCFSCGFASDLFEYFNIHKERYIDQKAEEVLTKIRKLLSNKPLSIPLEAVHFKEDFRDISAKTLREFGAFTSDKLYGKDFEGRIIFPVYNINKDIVVFQGRFLYSDLDPKYKNYPENRSLPLYPSIVNPINNSIILVEGFFDMLNLHDKGLRNAVTTFGTSFGSVKKQSKKKNNIERLLQYRYQGVDTIYIMYDGDKAGRDAAKNLKNYIGDVFYTDTIDLEDGIDPGKLSEQSVRKLKEVLYG